MLKQTNWAHWIAGQIGVPPLSISNPGEAKSDMHRTLAENSGRTYMECLLSQMIPEDMRGCPEPRDVKIGQGKYRVTSQVLDEQIVRATVEPTVMLIDELTCVHDSMQAAALQWICNPHHNCWIFAAGNPPDIAAAGNEISPPMVNRLCILEWEFDRDSWANGMTEGGGFDFPMANIPTVPDTWRSNVALYAGKINEYVNTSETELSRPEYLMSFPDEHDKQHKPYASPRSWTRLAWALGAADSVGASSITKGKLACGLVGDGLGSQLLAYLEVEGLRNPEEILSDPYSVDVPVSGSMAISYTGSVILRIEEDNSPERWEAARIFLASVHKQNPEVAQIFKGKLWRLKPDGHQPDYNEYFDDMENERVSEVRKPF